MYCGNCGGTIQPGQNFCNRCGQAAASDTSAPPPPAPFSPTLNAAASAPAPYSSVPQQSRVARHITLLGILWIVYSALQLIPAGAMLIFGHAGFPFLPAPLRGFLIPIIGGLGAFLAIAAAVGIVAGWALLARQPWGRIFAIVIACLRLISFPIGTALGIYTFWVLAAQGAEAEYQRMAQVS
ncbi:MAG: zinc ribbon domain-containing protein [Terriglobia bacterium]